MKKNNNHCKESSEEMIEDEIFRCRAEVKWSRSEKKRLFLEKYNRDLAIERKKWNQKIRKERRLRVSAAFRAIGNFFTRNIFAKL